MTGSYNQTTISLNSQASMLLLTYFRGMFKRLQFALSALLIFIAQTASGQGLYQHKMDGPYVLLFKLNAEQAAFLAKNPHKIDTQYLYSRLVGKVHSDSIIPLQRKPIDPFPVKPFYNHDRYQRCYPKFHIWDISENGTYIEVTVNSLFNVSYRVIENAMFKASVYRIGFETFVFVEDSAGLPVYNATVKLDTAHCRFDSSIGGYRIPGKNIFGLLRIERGPHFTINHVNGVTDKTNNTNPPRDNYNYAKINYQGYLVTNKPRYKTWDTLFFKSFLVNKKGKPIKETLIARLYQNYSGYAKEIVLKPTERGAYNAFFVINDSFVIDQELVITLLDAHRNQIKWQSVSLENYELKDIFFSVKADKNLVTPGGGIKIFVSATTANRLPIMDGKITLKMRLNNVNYTDGDSVVIPMKKWENWYSISVQTDPSGVTVFDIPDSIFIALDGGFDVYCSLLTADNETREGSISFQYQTTRDRLESRMDGDTLRVNRLYNMKDVRRKMRIKIYTRWDLMTDTAFYTPLNLYLPPNVYMAQILRGDTLSGTFYRSTQLPDVSGKRTHDSIHIAFKSAFDIPVFYRIYANNKLVAKGNATELNWHAFDKSKNSYHLQYGILEGSVTNPRFYSKSFHLAEKELSVDIIQPATVYPGQEVPIEIVVKDAYGKPVNKVNLAAWAVNTQLEGIVTPDVPYLGLVKTQKPLPTYYWPIQPITPNYNGQLKAWQIGAFMLRKNEAFKLAWPEKGFAVLTDTTPKKTTEIDFFAHGHYYQRNIVYVKANDTLIWAPQINPRGAGIRIRPGNYNFTIRTYDQIYTFKNVEIKAGKKHFLCLQIDTLAALKMGDSTSPGMLTAQEIEMLFKNTMLFRYDQPMNDTLVVKVNGKVWQGIQYGYSLNSYFNSIQLKTHLYNPGKNNNSYSTFQNFYITGPFNENNEIELLWKNNYSHIFSFKPGVSVSLTRTDMITDYNADWANYLRYLALYSDKSYIFNNFWWDPNYKDTTKHIYNPGDPVEPPHYSTELEEFQYSDYNPGNSKKGVLNSVLNLYLDNKYAPRRIWLFNREDSSYSILENSNYFGNYYANIGMHAQRYWYTYAPQKQQQHFRMVMQIDDTTWYVKNIDIDSSVHLFMVLKSSEFRKLGKKEHIFYDRLAKNLTREALIKWIDTPTVNTGLFIIPLKNVKGGTSIEGTVIGPDIKYPVNNAFVVLEKNGIFVQGAFTNREGRFKMENLQPGKYMLKIKGSNYHYWLHYSLDLNAGFNHLVQAEMRPYAWMRYNTPVYDADADGTSVMYEADSYSAVGATPQMSMRAAPSGNYSVEIAAAKAGRFKNAQKMKSERKDAMATADVLDSEISMREGNVAFKWEFGEGAEPGKANAPAGWTDANKKQEEDRLNKLAGDKNAQKRRKDFKDYAYWIPNLYTNKQGRTAFTVKYPDNVTSWQTFVPAMDGKRHTGLGELTVRSYKPVVTSLALPLFLTEGDSLIAYGRVMNYTGNNLTGRYGLKNNQNIFGKEINFKDFYSDSMPVRGTKPGDTLSIEASIELANGYRDAELRRIIVNAANVITGKSFFDEINTDSTLVFKADSTDMGMDVAVYNHKLAAIIDMIKQIENLPAYDNRSIASYLNALLIKKSICITLGIPFTQEKEIRETMGKLKKAQGNNGLFAWFKGGKESFVVSTYVADAMYRAHKMGYENNTWLNAARVMENNLPHVWGTERLEYLLTLKTLQRKVDYDSFIKPLKPANMDRSEKLEYFRLLQLLNKKIPMEEIDGMMQVTYQGNLMIPGTWNWRIAPITDDASNTYKAWQILFDANANADRRKALVNYLANECNSYGSSWIKAAEALVAEAMRDSVIKRDLKPMVEINGQLLPLEKMPAIYHLKPGQTLTLKHSGSPVYIAGNRKYRTYKPVTDSSQFNIVVNMPKVKNNQLQAGVPVEMKVTVFAKRNQFNSVIEVPIPAGCVFGTKIQSESMYETHREYQTDRVLIFSDELAFGYHTFTIVLVPRFTGSFYTAPARSALMFYPDKAAFSPKQRWLILK